MISRLRSDCTWHVEFFELVRPGKPVVDFSPGRRTIAPLKKTRRTQFWPTLRIHHDKDDFPDDDAIEGEPPPAEAALLPAELLALEGGEEEDDDGGDVVPPPPAPHPRPRHDGPRAYHGRQPPTYTVAIGPHGAT